MRQPDKIPSLGQLHAGFDSRFLRLSDLREGDLLFSLMPPSMEPSHVAIVTGKAGEGAVRQVHVVEDIRANLSGLHENDVVPENYLVYRCRREALAKSAAAYATKWMSVPAPYSTLRAAIAKEHEKKHGGEGDLVAEHRRLFQQGGKFRAIKYAARRDGDLVTVGERDSIAGNKGMFCSMFVVICFQVAGLEHLVEAAAPGTIVSDKRMTLKDRAAFDKHAKGIASPEDQNEFGVYLDRLHNVDPYELDTDATRFRAKGQDRKRPFIRQKYVPSLQFWRGGPRSVSTCDWPALLTEGMLVDAKVIYPRGLVESLQADPHGWKLMGIVTGERKFSEVVADKKQRMNAHQEEIVRKYFGRR